LEDEDLNFINKPN